MGMLYERDEIELRVLFGCLWVVDGMRDRESDIQPQECASQRGSYPKSTAGTTETGGCTTGAAGELTPGVTCIARHCEASGTATVEPHQCTCEQPATVIGSQE